MTDAPGPMKGRPKPSTRTYVCDACGESRPLFAMEEFTDFSTAPPTVRRVCTEIVESVGPRPRVVR